MKKTIKATTIFEVVWYSLCGAVALWGLTYTVLGLIANELNSKEVLSQGNKIIADTFGLGFFGWGLIILGIASLAIVIVLLIFAKRVDRDFEKTQRRAARRALQVEETVEETPAE